ncbi:MAG: flagellar biosynthesis anti-sigma factor FlgM [Ktedonobacteraceae bacterium]
MDSTFDLNLPPADCSPQLGVQGEMFTERGNQAEILTSMQKSCQATDNWPQNRAERVEILRQRVISGTYRVDSTELAQCIWHNSTRFLETGSVVAESDPAVAETR